MLVVSDKMVFLATSVFAMVLRILTAFAMARLLTPKDYGLLTLVAIAPSFISALGDCGIARALVQFQHLPDAIVEASGMVVSVALAVIYAAIFIGSGFYFYLHGYKVGAILMRHDARLPWIGMIGGLTLVLSAVYTFQMACLNRDLKFRAESRQNLIFAVALAVTGLSLALAARRHPAIGVFALATQPLAAQLVGNIMIYRRYPFHWPRQFQFLMAGRMLNYGWKVTLAQYANNLQQSVVSTCVGIVGGPLGLGIYGRATQVSDMVGYSLLSSFDRLLHPLMTSIRDDKERLRGIFIRGCIGATMLCVFGWACIVGTAPDLIRTIIGPQWGSVPTLLRIVSMVLLTSGIGTMAIIMTHALGKPLVWLAFAVANLAILGMAIAIGLTLHRDIASIALASAIAQSLTSIALWTWAIKTLNLSPAPLLWHIGRLIAAALAACGLMLAVRHFLPGALARVTTIAAGVRLIVAACSGTALFLALVFLIDRPAIMEFRSLVRRRKPIETPAAYQPPPPPSSAPGVWGTEVEPGSYENPLR